MSESEAPTSQAWWGGGDFEPLSSWATFTTRRSFPGLGLTFEATSFNPPVLHVVLGQEREGWFEGLIEGADWYAGGGGNTRGAPIGPLLGEMFEYLVGGRENVRYGPRTLRDPSAVGLVDAAFREPWVVVEQSPPAGRSIAGLGAEAAMVVGLSHSGEPEMILVGVFGFVVLRVLREPAAAISERLAGMIRGDTK